ncbi:hypothetical protein QA447_14355 [Pseudomonas sp. abacavir_1]
MEPELRAKIGIPADHRVEQTNTTWKQKSGRDTDTYWYDEFNAAGELVAKYVVEDSTSMYPPFGRSVTWSKE